MAEFKIPTLDEMHDILVRDHKNRIREDDVSPTSDAWKRERTTALAAQSLHAHIRQVDNNIMPDRSRGARLDRWGAIKGITRAPARGSSGEDALRVFGTGSVAIGDQLTSEDGLTYQITEAGSCSGGQVNVSLEAVDTGESTNKIAGAQLTFVSAPAGIENVATLVADCDGGADIQKDGPYRDLILARFSEPALGGAAADYRFWALAESYVDEAYVWPLRGGLLSVHVAGLKTGRGAARLLDAGEIAALQAAIDAVRPVGYADFLVLEVIAVDQDVEVELEPFADDAFKKDWTDDAGFTVAAYNTTTRELQLSADRPADLVVGARLIYKSTAAPYGDGREFVVEGLVSTDSVVLAADDDSVLADSPPVAGDAVFSGGPLVAEVRDGILAMMDLLGPARPDSVSSDDFSATGTTYWDGSLRIGRLKEIAQGPAGTLDSTIVTPTANVTPANAAPEPTVELLVPRQIIVRYL